MSSIFLTDRVEIDGSGGGTIRFPQVPPFQRWTIDRISLTLTGGVLGNTGAEARLFKGAAVDSNFIDGTNAPWNDVYAAPLELLPPDFITVVYTGATAGEIATVTIQGTRAGI